MLYRSKKNGIQHCASSMCKVLRVLKSKILKMCFSQRHLYFFVGVRFFCLSSTSHYSPFSPQSSVNEEFSLKKKKKCSEDKQTSQAPHSAQQGTRAQLSFISQWRWSVLGEHFQRAGSFWRCSAGWWMAVPVILCPAEMPRGSAPGACGARGRDTRPAGHRRAAQGLLNTAPARVFSKNGWDKRFFK